MTVITSIWSRMAAATAVGAAGALLAAPSAVAAPVPAPQLPAQGLLSQGLGAWSG
ncbi:hypothetical protein [Gordonia hirsuta]|uniref:hypothetical protein n=1 Tax=Gordonia hirsuta TaxID=53427 RepID=UPI00034DF232|nr:hypothetical protein [Gordonia hirsuta]